MTIELRVEERDMKGLQADKTIGVCAGVCMGVCAGMCAGVGGMCSGVCASM